MGYHFGTVTSDGTRVGQKLGSYGIQPYVSGLWFAAYAADRRPEANRVAAWVAPHMDHMFWEPMHPDAPIPQRNKPSTAQDLLDFDDGTDDGCTYTYAQSRVLELGCKFKPPKDPDLADLVAFHRVINSDTCEDLTDVALIRRLAPLLRSLLPRIENNPWYPQCRRMVETMEAAAASGTHIYCG